jgi:hypothetical protein
LFELNIKGVCTILALALCGRFFCDLKIAFTSPYSSMLDIFGEQELRRSCFTGGKASMITTRQHSMLASPRQRAGFERCLGGVGEAKPH